MTATRRFPAADIEELGRAKILGVRAGDTHPYTGVWVVTVKGRVFVRSWNDKPSGWYRAFRAEPAGSISVGKREIAVRALTVRGASVRQAVSDAYREKYDTRASEKWVLGFAEAAREAVTLEFVPA